jgi:hypothetical protein
MTTTAPRHGDPLLADRKALEHAAAWLRQNAWQEHYAGFGEKERAFQLATLMESMGTQLDRVPDELRTEAVRVAGRLVG